MEVQIWDLFDLDKIVESGQCFRAAVLPGGIYRFLTRDQVLYIRYCSDHMYAVSCNPETWERIWRPYFDLDRDYESINRAIPATDSFLVLAAHTGAGIRILRQDPWEMLITFLISQRKSIPAIRSVVEQLSRRYGTELRTDRETLYLFPTPLQLRDVSAEEYAACKAGSRAPYLYDAVQKVLDGSLDLQQIAVLADSDLLATLECVRGVGRKVASCIALFAYGRTACAPVDTWIRRIIHREYGDENPFAKYGDVAGIMQQYFFYYAQGHKSETW